VYEWNYLAREATAQWWKAHVFDVTDSSTFSSNYHVGNAMFNIRFHRSKPRFKPHCLYI